jgi:hypothetical protein
MIKCPLGVVQGINTDVGLALSPIICRVDGWRKKTRCWMHIPSNAIYKAICEVHLSFDACLLSLHLW